jgi:hypothetical protein
MEKLIFTILLLGSISLFAQIKIPVNTNAKQSVTQEKCKAAIEHNKLLQINSSYAAKVLQNESIIQQILNSGSRAQTVYTIPVVVHVMHLGENVGVGTNISDAQIQSAIDNLNDCYGGLSPYITDVGIQFSLAKRTPVCASTTGIIRVDCSGFSDGGDDYITVGATDNNRDALKALSKWPNTSYYNIWIVNEIDNNDGGAGTQGYAYFPGASSTVDGAVILYNSFGYDPTGTLGYNLKSYTNYNATANHELGHALNLYHTFEGDFDDTSCPSGNQCGSDLGDCCSDTDPHKRSDGDCGDSGLTCAGAGTDLSDIVTNIMAYSSDVCQVKYTTEQQARMRAALEGTRAGLISSLGATVPPAQAPNTTAANCEPVTQATGLGGGFGGIMQVKFASVVSTTSNSQGDGAGDYPTGYVDKSLDCSSYAELEEGETFNVSVSTWFNDHNVKVYVDWNNDATLAAGEEELSLTVNTAHPTETNWKQATGQITVPVGATTDSYLRIRFNADINTVNSSCESPLHGQVEDYALYVNSSACTPPSITLTEGVVSCYGESNGSVTSAVSGGETPYTYLWSTAGTTVDITGLPVGTYTVTITENQGCTVTESMTVTEPQLLAVTLTPTNIICMGLSDGMISTLVQGGNTPYIYAWSNAATTDQLSGLVAGIYSITIVDNKSCTVAQATTITEPTAAVTVSLLENHVSCYGSSDGAVQATISGGDTPYTYNWSNSGTTSSITGLLQGVYTLTSTDANNCLNIDVTTITEFTPLLVNYEAADTKVGSGYALSFSGSEYISTSVTSSFTDISATAWVKTTSGSFVTVIGASEGIDEKIILYIESGKVKARLTDATPLTKIYASTEIVNDGNWHHIAFTYDAAGDNLNIYVDGMLDTNVETPNAISFSMTTNNITIASFPIGVNNFVGEIDELRCWTKELTQTDVRTDMCKKVTSSHASMCDLLAYYRFDENSGSTLKDWIGSNNGTFVGLPSYVLSGAAIGDDSDFDYNGASSTVNLAHEDGDDFNVNITSGSPNGVQVYRVDNMPNSTNGIEGTDNDRYFGVYISGSGANYTGTYNYDGHTYGVASTEASLLLFGRQNNFVSTWLDETASINTTANTLEVTGVSSISNEYFLQLDRLIWTGTTDSDWGTITNWTSGTVPVSTDHITIPDVTNKPLLDADRSVGNVYIETNSSISLGTSTLSVVNSWNNNGTLISGTGTISFNGTDIQTIEGTNDYMNLTINNTSGGVTVSSGQQTISGTLTLTNGLFTTNDSLLLSSTSTGTARVAEITGGSISGDVTCERYLPSSNQAGWRILGSPISGVTLAAWNDDFLTSGFTGSNDPSFSWISLYSYNETIAGDADAEGWEAPTAITDPINVGEGYEAYIHNVDTTIDVTGTLNTGDISLNVSYTNSGSATDDGWTLVANPYMSTIDWDDADWVKTKMNNAVFIWDHINGVNASYVGGVSNNGGGPLIASSQGFAVQANDVSPVLTAKEGVKSSTDHTFWRKEAINVLRLELEGAGYRDQTTIAFNTNASIAFEEDKDARKFNNMFPAPNFVSTNGTDDFSINSLSFDEDMVIPLKTLINTSGVYSINVVDISDSINCVMLYDRYLDVSINLSIDSNYVFTIDDTTQSPRFEISFCEQTFGSLHENQATSEILNVYPNPTAGEFVVVLNNYSVQELEIRVVNSFGQIVISDRLDVKKGTQTIELNLGNFGKGMYFIQTFNDEGIYSSTKIVKSD